MNVTVIWDAWSDVPRDRRAGIILDAYREARGQEGMLAISVALGLTRQEADKLGVAADVAACATT